MTTTDFVILSVAAAALALMLVFSKVTRTIAWETIRHPFVRSRIDVDDGDVTVHREESAPNNKSEAHIGAR